MINWTTLINSAEPFVKYTTDHRHRINVSPYSFSFPTKYRSDGLKFDIHAGKPTTIDRRRAMFSLTEYRTIGSPDYPSAPSPAPAQTAKNMTIIWCDQNTDVATKTRLPSVLVVSNLRKWYCKGKLHRKGIHPALHADYVGAIWYDTADTRGRCGAPHTIGIEGYKEFYQNGEYQGYRANNIYEIWNKHLVEAAKDIVGQRYPLSTEYCGDVQDRFMLTAMG